MPIERMAPVLPITVMAAEDGRFCRHRGIDWRASSRPARRRGRYHRGEGRSTITQQTAKNLFLRPGRSMPTRHLESPAGIVDRSRPLPKWRVLEMYLNIAEWGPNGQFGAEAASKYAFNKSVRALTVREAALLASVLPNPRRAVRNNRGRRCAGLQRFMRCAALHRQRLRLRQAASVVTIAVNGA